MRSGSRSLWLEVKTLVGTASTAASTAGEAVSQMFRPGRIKVIRTQSSSQQANELHELGKTSPFPKPQRGVSQERVADVAGAVAS